MVGEITNGPILISKLIFNHELFVQRSATNCKKDSDEIRFYCKKGGVPE